MVDLSYEHDTEPHSLFYRKEKKKKKKDRFVLEGKTVLFCIVLLCFIKMCRKLVPQAPEVMADHSCNLFLSQKTGKIQKPGEALMVVS